MHSRPTLSHPPRYKLPCGRRPPNWDGMPYPTEKEPEGGASWYHLSQADFISAAGAQLQSCHHIMLGLKTTSIFFYPACAQLKKSKKKTNPTPYCLRITLKSSSHLILNLSAWTLSRYHLKSPNFRAKTWPCDESLWSTKTREKRNSLKVFTLKVSLKVTLNMLQIISTI